MQDDKRLAERMRRGDRGAYEEFVDRFGGRVHRLVRRHIESDRVSCVAMDAEDVTQEIFVDLYRGIGGFRGEASLSTWVYRVAMNHCLKHRGRSGPVTVPFEDALHARQDDHVGADPARHAARRELSDLVRSALAHLSPLHRDVVILHEMHGLTYGECAAILGVPVGTVKSRLSNAFRRLRARLGGYVLGGEESVPCVEPITEIGS